jgi:hypothetical protein
VVLRVLNRLIGRTDSSADGAVNAYVEGSASQSEINLVEQMMRENPALEKDLSTQKSLLSVLGRIDRIEVPRSFAVTPEMVAAAEGSESSITRFIDMFAPQRKLAMAPAVIAVIAALSVALLTIGDIAGVVEQSNDRINDSASTAASAELGYAADSDDLSVITESGSAPQIEMATEPETAAGGGVEEPKTLAAGGAAASTAAPAATAAQAEAPVTSDAPPSTSALAPAPETAAGGDSAENVEPVEKKGDTVVTLESDGATTARSGSGSSEDAAPPVDSLEMAASTDLDGSPLLGGTADAELAAQNTSLDDGISLPLWQIQIALAALALAAIGAWAGIRRARG